MNEWERNIRSGRYERMVFEMAEEEEVQPLDLGLYYRAYLRMSRFLKDLPGDQAIRAGVLDDFALTEKKSKSLMLAVVVELRRQVALMSDWLVAAKDYRIPFPMTPVWTSEGVLGELVCRPFKERVEAPKVAFKVNPAWLRIVDNPTAYLDAAIDEAHFFFPGSVREDGEKRRYVVEAAVVRGAHAWEMLAYWKESLALPFRRRRQAFGQMFGGR